MNTERYYTAAELAGLQGMPKTAQGINVRAKREGWESRRRSGRGGGREYALDSLPSATQIALYKKFGAPGEEKAAPEVEATVSEAAGQESQPLSSSGKTKRVTHSEEALADRWDRLRDHQREKAEAKCAVIRAALAAHERGGVPLNHTLKQAAKGSRWSFATLRDDYYGRGIKAGLVDYPQHLWPLVLAPGHLGRTATAEITPEAWEALKRDYLREEEPTLEDCYRTLQKLAARNGWTIPGSAKTLSRRLDREVPKPLQILARKGAEALVRMIPPQQRDHASLRVMELVNADGHRFDVFVKWPDGTIERPMMVAWQEVRSSKVLSWRVDRTENSDGYRLSFSDLLREHGAPGGAILDNGRGIASKLLTGGTPNRFRGKIKEEDPVGLITQMLGPENIHWAKPYSGQSKPIERAFRDMASDIAKDYRFRGAYTGPNPQEKPENYASKAVPLDRFLAVVDERIKEHNARRGRRGMGMYGNSFDEVFEAGYQENAHLIPKPTQAQLDRWLLGALGVTANYKDGSVQLYGNRYWNETLAQTLAYRPKAARQVVVRHDPDHLDRPVLVETLDGRLIARAEPLGTVGMLDSTAAREKARAERRLKKLAEEQRKIHQRMDEREFERLLDQAGEDKPAPAQPERKVVRAAVLGERRSAEPRREEGDSPEEMIAAGDTMILALAKNQLQRGPLTADVEEEA